MGRRALKIAGIVLLVLGTLGVPGWAAINVVGFFKAIADFQRVDVPGAATFHLSGGHYTVFLETNTATAYNSRNTSSVEMRVMPTSPSGTPASIKGYSANSTYSLGSKQGRGYRTFDIDRSGDYRVSTSGPSRAGTRSIVFGKPLGRFIWRGVIGSILIFFGLGTAGVLLLTYTDRPRSATQG